MLAPPLSPPPPAGDTSEAASLRGAAVGRRDAADMGGEEAMGERRALHTPARCCLYC